MDGDHHRDPHGSTQPDLPGATETRLLRTLINLHLWDALAPGAKTVKPDVGTVKAVIGDALPLDEAQPLLHAVDVLANADDPEWLAALETLANAASPDRELLELAEARGIDGALSRRLRERAEIDESLRTGGAWLDPEPLDETPPRRQATVAPLDEGPSTTTRIARVELEPLAEGRVLVRAELEDGGDAIAALRSLVAEVAEYPLWVSLAYAVDGGYVEIDGPVRDAQDVYIEEPGRIAFVLPYRGDALEGLTLTTSVDQLYVYPDFELAEHDKAEAAVRAASVTTDDPTERPHGHLPGFDGWIAYPSSAPPTDPHAYRDAQPADDDLTERHAELTVPALEAFGFEPLITVMLRHVTDGSKLALRFERRRGGDAKKLTVTVNAQSKSLTAGLGTLVFALSEEAAWPLRLQIRSA